MNNPARSAALGGLIWVVLAVACAARWIRLDLIELLFLFAPLVIVPLGLALLAREQLRPGVLLRLACLAQPIAALLAVGSFFLTPGPGAAALATPWLAMCILVALAGAKSLLRVRLHSASALCLVAAQLYLAVGGLGLFLSRLGATPLHFAEPVVLLTGVHFHYTGFALPLVAGSVGCALDLRSGLYRLFFPTAVLILVSPTLLAAGFVFSPLLKLAAVLLLVLGCLLLAVLMLPLAVQTKPRLARALFFVASVSLAVAMLVAATYELGDFTARYWLLIPQMARLHGTLNAFGFALCGLLGCLWILPDSAGRSS